MQTAQNSHALWKNVNITNKYFYFLTRGCKVKLSWLVQMASYASKSRLMGGAEIHEILQTAETI